MEKLDGDSGDGGDCGFWKASRNTSRGRVDLDEALDRCLPPEDGSIRPQTLGKRVSDDSQTENSANCSF